MKSKTFYLVEGRRRHRSDRYVPNSVDAVIGLYPTLKMAENYIKCFGEEFYPSHHKANKDKFFAIVELPVAEHIEDWGGYLNSFWTKDGKKI